VAEETILRRTTFLLFAGLIAILLPGFAPWPLRAQSREQVNVVLIALDQLQADQLHCYGNPRGTSPNIDRLAEQGVRFSHYYTVAPWTAPSYSSLMTSLYPSRHGVTIFWKPERHPLNEKVPMLAEVFKAAGYQTAAFVNNSVAGRGLTGRGFDEYYEMAAKALNIVEREPTRNALLRAPGTTDSILAWLDQHHSQPFFLWALFLEPHSPYNPPPEHDIFKSDAYPNLQDNGYDIKSAPLLRMAMLGDHQAIERLYQLYDGKIHFVDYYVGRILDRLQKLGLNNHTLIILTSDHGELMFSHPRDFLTADHVSLYDPVMHVPLIMAGPTLPPGVVVNALGANIDAGPTILDLAGLPPLPDAQGRSLVPLIQHKSQQLHDYVYGEEDIVVPLRSVRNLQYKLIYNLWDGRKELYDLRRDPGEQQDIAEQNPSVTAELFARLQGWMRENQPSPEEQVARWKTFMSFDTQVVDDQTVLGQVLLTGGGWHSDQSPQSGNYEGGEIGTSKQLPKPSSAGGCFWTEGGDGSRTAVWRPMNPMTGTYMIYVFYGHPAVDKLATNAPFEVFTREGSKTIRVNLNLGAGQWNLLGKFKNPRYVRENNQADGNIIADAIKWEPLP
jgi:arylsulfatase